MNSIKELNQNIIEDRDYEYVGIADDPGWAIQLKTGSFQEAIIHYKRIEVVPVNDEETTLSFDYNVLNPTILAEDIDTEKLGQYCGDVLMVAIQTGLEKGTATLDDGQSEQDYPTLTLN